MRLFSRLTFRCAIAGAVAGATALAGTAVAIADGKEAEDTRSATAPAVAPSHAVEDFEYPQADRIFRERGIKLKRGDGHIVLAECGSRPDLVEVRARDMEEKEGNKRFCFRVTGKTGYLSLELPSVHLAKGNDYTVHVNMVTGDEGKSWDLKKNAWTAVGESSAAGKDREFTLLEIVAKK